MACLFAGKAFGVTEYINPDECREPVQQVLHNIVVAAVRSFQGCVNVKMHQIEYNFFFNKYCLEYCSMSMPRFDFIAIDRNQLD